MTINEGIIDNSPPYFVSLLSLIFPRRIQEIVKICLMELTDYRIEQMIKLIAYLENSDWMK